MSKNTRMRKIDLNFENYILKNLKIKKIKKTDLNLKTTREKLYNRKNGRNSKLHVNKP